MGGSKVSSKIEIINNLLDKVDNLILAGGMTYTFAKAFGGKIGNSIVEDDKLDLAKELVEKAKENRVNLMLGKDAKIADSYWWWRLRCLYQQVWSCRQGFIRIYRWWCFT